VQAYFLMCAWEVDQMLFKNISLVSLLVFFIQISNVSIGCSFNCGGPYSSQYKLGVKPPSYSSYKEHEFSNGPAKKHSFQYITDPKGARAGKSYQRFELRDGDCFPDRKGTWNDCKMNRERFEFTSKPRQKPMGKQCYAYSIMLEKSFQAVNPTNTDLGQIHQTGGPKGTAGGLKSFPPLIQIGAKNNSFYFGWHKLSGDANNVVDRRIDYELAKLSDMKNVWTDISFCLDFENKRMDAWVNGKKKIEINQSPINFTPEKIYFKYGIYRSFVSKYKSLYGKMPTQIVFYDEIRRGTSIEDVDRNINPNLKPID